MSFSFFSLYNPQSKSTIITNILTQSGLVFSQKSNSWPYQKKFVVVNHDDNKSQVKKFMELAELQKVAKSFQEIEVAEVDGNIHVKIDEENLLILPSLKLETFYQNYLNISEVERYSASVNISEFHTYIVVEDSERNIWKGIGGTVYPIGEEIGNFYVRNDTTYHQKYSRQIVDHVQGYNSFFDKAHHYVKKYISVSQLSELKSHAAEEFCAAKDLKSQKYSVIGVDGRNCADFSTFASKYIFDDHNWFRFLDVDKLDYRDKGVLYNFWSSYGFADLFIFNFPKVLDAVLNNRIGQGIDELAYQVPFMEAFYYGATKAHIFATHRGKQNKSDDIEDLKPYLFEKNFFGNTPLHDALLFGKFENAKCLFVAKDQLEVKNNRGETPLMLLSKLPASELKHELMQEWINLSNVNECDLFCEHTALTHAILSEDKEAVKILLNNGANLKFINNVLDGIGNIAASYGKFGALDIAINHAGTEFLYNDNLTRQLPICIIRDSESKDPDLMYLKGYLHEELAGDLPCKTHDEYHNIFEDHQQIEFLI